MTPSGPMSDLYAGKSSGYYDAPRLDLLRLLAPARGLRVLEIGCGTGATLQVAKQSGLASFTIGVDPILRSANSRPDLFGPDVAIPLPIEELDYSTIPGPVDAIICGDVLEHLVDPWEALRKLSSLLLPRGSLVASIPNFRNHRALAPILFRGDFSYADAGLLDRTHLRFFCRKNVVAMFQEAGLSVSLIAENMGAYGVRHRFLDWLTFREFHDFFVFQFLCLARRD